MTSSAHVTSSVTLPVDSPWPLSYSLPIVSKLLGSSPAVSEIFSIKDGHRRVTPTKRYTQVGIHSTHPNLTAGKLGLPKFTNKYQLLVALFICGSFRFKNVFHVTITRVKIRVCLIISILQCCPVRSTSKSTRSSSTQLLFVPRHNLSFGSRAFRISALQSLEYPTSSHQAIQSFSTFRCHLKTHYFQLAYPAT